MTRSELAAAIFETSHLTGTFLLRSGRTASVYFDKYRFESDPDLLAAIAAHLMPLVPTETELLAGLELGGVPIATALSLRTGLPTVFVRKHAKGYGTRRLAEGAEIFGRRLLVIEDVITSGGQVARSSADLREPGQQSPTRCASSTAAKEAGRHFPRKGYECKRYSQQATGNRACSSGRV